MKNILYKIIINLSIIILLGGCHNLEHRKLFFEAINKNIVNKKVKSEIIPIDNVKSEIIPIDNIKSEIIKKKINLQFFINFSENQLYSKIGKGDFIKEEGKLKNIQYYFTKCFLDIFLIKRNNDYHVTLLQIRSILLNGSINKNKCLDEISSKFKTNFN